MVLLIGADKLDAVRAHFQAAGESFYDLVSVVSGNKKAVMKGGVFGE